MLNVIRSNNILKTLVLALSVSFAVLVYKTAFESDTYHGYGGLISAFNLLAAWAGWLILASGVALICRIKYLESEHDTSPARTPRVLTFLSKIIKPF